MILVVLDGCRGIWKLLEASTDIFVEAAVDGSNGSFSTSTDSGNFHVLPWKLSQKSMDLNLLPPTSMEKYI